LHSLQQQPGRGIRIPGAYILHSGYDTTPEGQARKRALHEPLLQKDVEEYPDHPMPRFNMGMTRHQQREFAEAIPWLRQCIERAQPSDSITKKAYALLGASHLELGEDEAALQVYLDGMSAVGPDSELLFRAAVCVLQLNAADADTAIRCTQRKWNRRNDANHLGLDNRFRVRYSQ